MKPSVGVIGAGKVGCALARLCYHRGYRVEAVYSRTLFHAQAMAAQVGGVAVGSGAEVAQRVDLTLLTVPDDAIKAVADGLAGMDWTGKAVVHSSGAYDAQQLSMLAMRGAWVGSLHPAFPFADCETGVARLPGATFAIEAEAEVLRQWLRDMVTALGGQALIIPPGQKALYHAALVLVSNYTVTLYAAGEQILLGLGAEYSAAREALTVLLGATVENLRTQGIPGALTGPLVRGDVGTVNTHLQALEDYDDQLATIYRELARLTLPLAAARGASVAAIESLLEGK